MEVGITSFAETTPDPATGAVTGHGVRLREVIEEIVLADQTGLDVYGLGEHHRPDFAASAPAVVLAGAATRTSRIRLSSAVSVLSSDDPVRVFQQFATLDLISGGRAEIMAGRGSFIESFPLFGYALEDYEELFAEKLELLLAIRERERVTWSGRHRAPIEDRGVYPRPAQDPLPVWVAVGGTPRSVVRAGLLGLPLALAIIGGQPERFAPLVALYRDAARQGGHDPEALPTGVHVHGWIAETSQRASEEFYGPYAYVMSMIGRERGWPPFTRAAYEAALGPGGHLAVGSAEQVAEKLLAQMEVLGHRRVLLHLPVGTMPHDRVMQAIERLGAEVAPVLRREGGRPARAA
ncbi:MAG: LLM class flavin-dependent oxidoreductase [Thermoleophilia bacterium]|nr:LLM class flavin-dependent oxidoreductase [Thermoleophilia bacterium]